MGRAVGTPYNGILPKEKVESEDDRQRRSNVIMNAIRTTTNVAAYRTSSTAKVAEQSPVKVD